VVPRANTFKPAAAWYFPINLLFGFALAERKTEQQEMCNMDFFPSVGRLFARRDEKPTYMKKESTALPQAN